MKLRMFTIPVLLFVSLNLVGCGNNQAATQSTKTSYQLTDFVKYKGSYVGDNSAVGNILSMLPAHEYLTKFSLETGHVPYGITVNYQASQSGLKNSKHPAELLERNAAVLFALVQNVEVVRFNVQDVGKESYTFTRTNVQQKYRNLSRILDNQVSLTSFLNGEG